MIKQQSTSDSSVSSVCSSSSLGSSVDLHVIYCQVLQVLGVGIGLKVLEQSQDNLDGLLWPSTQTPSEFLSLTCSADASVVSGEWDASSLGEDILQICLSLVDTHALNCSGSLISVLIVDSEISA